MSQIACGPEQVRQHSIIQQVRQSFVGCSARPGEVLVPRIETCFTFLVTQGSLERTFDILDRVLKKLEERGYPPTVGTEHHIREPGIMVGTLSFRLKIQERRKPIKHVPTPAEQRLLAKHPYTRDVPKYDHEPTGKLTVTTSYIYNESWADRRAARLEDEVDALVERLVATSLSVEKSRKESAERQRREELAAEQRRRDEKRYTLFKNTMTKVREARDLREFVAEIRAVGASIDPDSGLAELLAWADEYADRIDPLKPLREAAAEEARERSAPPRNESGEN